MCPFSLFQRLVLWKCGIGGYAIKISRGAQVDYRTGERLKNELLMVQKRKAATSQSLEDKFRLIVSFFFAPSVQPHVSELGEASSPLEMDLGWQLGTIMVEAIDIQEVGRLLTPACRFAFFEECPNAFSHSRS